MKKTYLTPQGGGFGLPLLRMEDGMPTLGKLGVLNPLMETTLPYSATSHGDVAEATVINRFATEVDIDTLM